MDEDVDVSDEQLDEEDDHLTEDRSRKDRHIFDNEYVTELCRMYQQSPTHDVYAKICAATNDLMDTIIRNNGFHHVVPLDDLKNALFLNMQRWVSRVNVTKDAPKSVYTYLSASCVKETRILTPTGGLPIIELIERFKAGQAVRVVSFDFDHMRPVIGDVVNYHLAPSNPWEWAKINLGKKEEFFTWDHEWPVLDSNQKVSWPALRDLCEGTGAFVQIQARDNADGFIQKPAWAEAHELDIGTLKCDLTVAKWRNFILADTNTIVSNCIKHGALSNVVKEQQLRQRVVFSELDPEVFGESGSGGFDESLKEAMLGLVNELEVRWVEPHIREIIRFCIHAIITGRGDRRPELIATITNCWEVTPETAKFLLDWSHGAVRSCILDHYDPPIGEIDAIRASEKYSFIPDVIATIGMEPTRRLLSVFAGTTIKFPSTTALKRSFGLNKKGGIVARLLEEVPKGSPPQAVEALAKEFSMSTHAVEALYESVCSNIRSGLLNDLPLYGEDAGASEIAPEQIDWTKP